MDEKAILLIDDDPELGRLLTDYLQREGYQVRHCLDGRTGLEAAHGMNFALVLLDVMLPGMDGFEVLRALRRETTTAVIMLTARGEEIDRIVGLEMGADDYLPKPFNPRELLARMKAVLRRMDAPDNGGTAGSGNIGSATGRPERMVLGPLALEPEGFRVWMEGEEVLLTPIEFCILRELVQAAGRVLSRDTLLDRVRGRDFEAFDRSIDVHVSHLRQKLGDDPNKPLFIKTVRGVGYQFLIPSQR